MGDPLIEDLALDEDAPKSRFAFYEIVNVLDTPHARKGGIGGTMGVVRGIAPTSRPGISGYAIWVNGPDCTFYVTDDDLAPTGRFAPESDFRSVGHIRVGEDGQPLGPVEEY